MIHINDNTRKGRQVTMNDKEKDRFLFDLLDKSYERGVDENELNILEKLSYDEEDFFRGIVAKILVNSETEKSEEILIRLAKDKNSLVRTEACDSLCISKSVTTYEMLKHIALKDRIGMVRAYAIMSLGDIAYEVDKEDELIEFLEEILVNETVVLTKINIYTVLYSLGVEKYFPDLLKLINSKKYTNRCAVARSLAEIVDEDNKDVIVEALLERKKIETAYSVISTIDTVLKEIEEMEFEDEEEDEDDTYASD